MNSRSATPSLMERGVNVKTAKKPMPAFMLPAKPAGKPPKGKKKHCAPKGK